MSTNEKKNWGPIISTIAAIVVFLVLYFMPLPEGLTPEAQKSMALFAFALIMWIAKPIPIYQTSLILILLLPMLGRRSCLKFTCILLLIIPLHKIIFKM